MDPNLFNPIFQRIIANVSCSTLFIHGESDSLIPAEHSLRLFKRCRARKLLVTPPKMEHNSNLFGDASFLAVPYLLEKWLNSRNEAMRDEEDIIVKQSNTSTV